MICICCPGFSCVAGFEDGHQHCSVTPQGWKIQPSIPFLDSLLYQLTQARLRSELAGAGMTLLWHVQLAVVEPRGLLGIAGG